MRILFLSTWFPYPPDNGSKIRAYYLLRALARSHWVTLVAFRPPSGSTNRRFPMPEPNDIQVYPVPADPYHDVNVPRVVKFASAIPVACWPSRLMRQTVAEVASSGQWDAVVAFQSSAARYALQLLGTPRILDVDVSSSYRRYKQYIQENSHIARLWAWVGWQKTRQYEIRLLRKFQACTLVLSAEADHIKAMLGSAQRLVEVIPNGVDCQHNRPDLAQPVPDTLVYNGALTYSANYDTMQYFLAEIYPLIRQKVPDVSLTITGSTSGVNLAGLPLDASVHLSGYVDDIRPLVAGASVCVVPIRQGGGTRLKILEAMALGTPVVTTSKGAEGLDVVDSQHILLADDPTTFARRTLELLQNPALRQRLATNARRLVEERYDWTQIGQRFVGLVEDITVRHRGNRS